MLFTPIVVRRLLKHTDTKYKTFFFLPKHTDTNANTDINTNLDQALIGFHTDHMMVSLLAPDCCSSHYISTVCLFTFRSQELAVT